MFVSLDKLLTEKVKPKKPNRPSGPAEPDKAADAGTDAAAKKRIKAQQKRAKTMQKNKRAATAAALEKNRLDRQARQQKLKDKKDPDKGDALGQVPAQLAHCMMAVHVKRGKTKKAAWNICRWSLHKHGYHKNYVKDARMPVKQTQKGVRRSFQHGSEKKPLNGGVPGDHKSKFRKFKKMFKSIEKDIEEK